VNDGADLFLVCVVVSAFICLMWREVLWILAILAVSVLCSGVVYVVVALHDVASVALAS